jgi:hypothetical protein
MDWGLDHSQSIFGHITGDPTHREQCAGASCENSVLQQSRVYAAIHQLHIVGTGSELQASLAMVAKFMLCDECRRDKSQSREIVREWTKASEEYLATIPSRRDQTRDASASSSRERDPIASGTHYWPTSISHAAYEIRRNEDRTGSSNASRTGRSPGGKVKLQHRVEKKAHGNRVLNRCQGYAMV